MAISVPANCHIVETPAPQAETSVFQAVQIADRAAVGQRLDPPEVEGELPLRSMIACI
jgi:hypothetical protein